MTTTFVKALGAEDNQIGGPGIKNGGTGSRNGGSGSWVHWNVEVGLPVVQRGQDIPVVGPVIYARGIPCGTSAFEPIG